MIDIHSHIISGIDDGSKDEAMSLKMLQKAVASGTTSIFATSHLLQDAHNPAWQDFLLYKKYRFEINLTSLLEKEKPQSRMHNLN